jgi:hypothetical protein
MLQIFELFQIFNELISLRLLSSTGGIEEVLVLSTNQTYVVGSSMVRGDFMSTRGILTVNLDRAYPGPNSLDTTCGTTTQPILDDSILKGVFHRLLNFSDRP